MVQQLPLETGPNYRSLSVSEFDLKRNLLNIARNKHKGPFATQHILPCSLRKLVHNAEMFYKLRKYGKVNLRSIKKYSLRTNWTKAAKLSMILNMNQSQYYRNKRLSIYMKSVFAIRFNITLINTCSFLLNRSYSRCARRQWLYVDCARKLLIFLLWLHRVSYIFSQ